MQVFFLGWFVGLVGPVQEIIVPCLAFCSRPSTKFFFLAVLYFNPLVPVAQKGWQAVVLGRLSLGMFL
jgi:hypothetical protein